MEIKLSYPVTHKGRTIDRLTLRRPVVRDNLIASRRAKGDVGLQEIHLLALLAETEPEVFEELDMADYAVLQGVLVDFLSSGRRLSGDSSPTLPGTTTGA